MCYLLESHTHSNFMIIKKKECSNDIVLFCMEAAHSLLHVMNSKKNKSTVLIISYTHILTLAKDLSVASQ